MKITRWFSEQFLRLASLGARRRTYKLAVESEERELLAIKDFITRVCDAGKCGPREAANVKLAVDEATTNIIRHAYGGKGGKIELEASLGPYDITVKVRDRGKPFDPHAVKDPDLNHYVDIGKKGGLGIWLIKKVMSRVEYHSKGGVNELVLVRYYDALRASPEKAAGRAARNIPVSAKFTLGAVALAVFIIVSAYAVLVHRQKMLLVSQQHEKILAILQTVSLEAGQALAQKQDLQLNQLVARIVQGDKAKVLSFAFLVGQDGRFLAHSDLSRIFQKWEPPPGLNGPGGTSVASQRLGAITYYAAEVDHRGHKVGEIWAGLDENAVARMLARAQEDLTIIAFWTLLLSVAAIYMLSRIITRPIEKIFQGVQALASGDMSHKIELDSQDEFGQLAGIFNEMTQKIQSSQQGLMEHERLQKEMQVAQEIQHTLLPADLPQIEGYEIGAMYRAAKEVGGDYYDFFWVDPTTVGIVVADVSGKGVPGSLVMTMIRTAMRLEARNNKSASDVLGRVNKHVTADMKKGMFVTMFYIVLDSRRRIINFSSAGHNPMILYRGRRKEVYYLKPKGFPLGISLPDDDLFQKSLALQKISLEKDDMLVVYTDGITEAMNKEKQQFGEDRLVAAIKENVHLTPAEFVEELNRRIADFTQGAEQSDDITVVAIKEKMKAETVLYKVRRQLFDLVDKKGVKVAEACRRLNVPASQYYRLKKLVRRKGAAALKPAKRDVPSLMAELTNDQKRAVLHVVKAHPEFGPERIAAFLRKNPPGPMKIEGRLVYHYLKRKGLNTESKRKGLLDGAIDSL